MDYLWSPWRYQYVKQAARQEGCVFCRIASADQDDENLVVRRGERNFVVLNRYPYTSGHSMVIPYEHHSTLSEAAPETLDELMRLTQRLEAAMLGQYRADGVAIGYALMAAVFTVLGVYVRSLRKVR